MHFGRKIFTNDAETLRGKIMIEFLFLLVAVVFAHAINQ
jgi:hypothetical protein